MPESDFYLSKNQHSTCGTDIKISKQYAKRLKRFQIEGIRFLHSRKAEGAILNDETGLGKTVQTILYISAIQFAFPSKKNIVICDEDSFDHWLFHIEKWTELTKSVFNDSSVKNISVASLDDAHSIQNQKWGIVIIDDCQGNHVVKKLSNLKCEFKIWLTNDNLLINLKKLHQILNWISPGKVMNWKAFESKYSNVDNIEESWKRRQLLDAYCKPWLLRRTKNMVADELPINSVESYLQLFREWKKQTYNHNQSNDSDVVIIENKHDVMEVEDSTTDDSQNFSPVIKIPSISVRYKEEELKRKGTKDITGLKIKRNRNNPNTDDNEKVHQILNTTTDHQQKNSNLNECTNKKSDNISEGNGLSKPIKNILSESCNVGQKHFPFKLLDDILFGCRK